MSPCYWCTPDDAPANLLQRYASISLPPGELAAANDDLCYCLECVDEYHKARDGLPSLHELLWDMETTRLVTHFETSMDAEDDLYIVEEDKEMPLFCCTDREFEKRLRVPLLEILKYPYLLFHERLSELCVEALCKLEKINYSYQVTAKHPGIYLLMVHPNEVIRRWAILTARNLGKVDRDDYYDIQEVLTCLFKVIELDLFENPDIYTSMTQKGKLHLLPSHLYDTSNVKNYWLGICMLLTVLEEQAMDSLLLGPDKQINFVQSMMSTMEKQTDDESNAPFWPALHCFMVILDKLGSKVWGQPVDPILAFQTITNSPSYKEEIKSIRQSCRRTKSEPLSDYGDDMITCSQIVYNYHTEKPQKDVGWKTAICPDYCPNMYEDMQTVADTLQYDVGRDMRLHNSTFLWFIPFVHSVMDLKEGSVFTGEVIHHLCSEIKEVFSDAVQYCDKVSEFFIWILVSVVELHHNTNCLDRLWVTSQKWVEAVVKCAMLPRSVFARGAERLPRAGPRVPMLPQGSDSVQSACMKLIRSLLKEGYQLGQKPVCELFLNKLNLFVRSSTDCRDGWQLSSRETQELQFSLKQVIRSLKDRRLHLPSVGENSAVSVTPPTLCAAQDQCPASAGYELCLPHSSPLQQDDADLERPLSRSGCLSSGNDQSLHRTSDCLLTNIKQEAEENSVQGGENLGCSKLANGHKDAQKNGICLQRCDSQSKCVSVHKSSHGLQALKARETDGKEEGLGASGKNHGSLNGGGTAEAPVCQDFVARKIKSEKSDWASKLKQLVANTKKSKSVQPPPAAASQQPLVGRSGGQEGRRGGGGAPNGSRCGREASATPAAQAALLSVKQELRDGLAEPQSTPKGERSLAESSSDEDMDHVPLLKIRQELVKKRSAPLGSSMTDSQVDRDLSKLSLATYSKVINFPVNSSQESGECCKSHLKRKVRGTARSWSGSNESSSDADRPPNGVIVISDPSSSDEDEGGEMPDPHLEKLPHRSLESAQEHKLPAAASSPLLYEECASQCFEFETEDDIYSAWEDSQVGVQGTEALDPPAEASCASALARDLEVARQINDWGYETDYLGEDVAEEAAEALEQQVQSCRREKQQAEKSRDAKAKVKMRVSAHKSPGRPGKKGSAPSQLAKAASKSQRPSTHGKKWPQARHVRTAPAVIPPQKVHHCPPPTSTAEKLFFKKAPRKAFELSQRSLDCVAKLRTYGKAAGELAVPQTRKSKLIPAQALLGKNRKLLACQDLQFFRQSRPRAREKGGSPRGTEGVHKQCAQQPVRQAAAGGQEGGAEHPDGSCSSERNQLQQRLPEREEVPPPPLPQDKEPPPLGRQGSAPSDMDAQESCSALPAPLGTSCPVSDPPAPPAPSSGLCSEEAAPGGMKSNGNKNVEEDDSLFLTQMDTLDMELCSQMEDVSCPIEVGPFGAGRCQHGECPERVDGAGLHCREHSSTCGPADHAFVVPPAPAAKLSTTKIFSSSSSSRSAQLTKELGNVSKPPVAPKSKPNPARPNDFKPQTPTFSSILRPQNANSIAPPPYMHSSRAGGVSRPLPAPGGQARQERSRSLPQAHGLMAQPRDHRIFIREVLRWSYDMFENFSQLGPPDNLFQSIVGPVPVRFQDYSDYFNTFFHLMMLNAFETVAQEWLETRKSKEQKAFLLDLLNFTADLSKADFTASLSESDLANQLHPKEDDLVFLIVSEKRSPCGDESEAESRLVPHIGLVTRFSQPSVHDTKKKEQQVTCHLSVQTQGNLSRVSSQVKCVVVSSLVTTQRKFRALLLLNRNSLCKAIIHPSYADFCPRGLSVEPETSASYVRDFNEDQRRAIETAYTMVTEHPSLPRICLIHGPPGTGKSKTILGLLCRILDEKSGMENPVQSLNAKVKRNRVLVCAPSNAAVDELMKKIILVFKEKCQNKANPLGNCGDVNLVRLGQEKSISKDILKFSLNDQVNHRMGRVILGKDQDPHMGKEDLCMSTGDLHKRKEELDRRLDLLSRQRAMDRRENTEKRQQLEDDICRLSVERQRLTSKLKKARGQSQELKTTIILESHIICCTLSTSGGVLMESAFRRQGYDPFSCIIVDEAGQACEVETLIPLVHGCKKLVLVGDPKQLPPTVKSMKAQDCGYDQSLMSRLCVYLEEQVQENLMGRSPILKLTTQYRMHPDLCLFPSNYIYGGSLKTSRQTETSRSGCNWPFQSYLLFDVQDGQEERDSDSFANPQEVNLVIELMKLIKQEKKDLGHRHIGIITPYSAQKRRILKRLDKEFRATRAGEVDTVDGFQGREKDCIIVTCVRANSTQGSIGFLRSLQRLNVTITRAKYSLFILGQLATLMDNKDWNELIQDAQKRGAIIRTSSHNYKHDATKILKPLRQPERVPRGQTTTAGSKQVAAPSRGACPATASTSAAAQRDSAARPSLPPPDSSRTSSLPIQAKPVQEWPQDPRLARRADSATAGQGTACREAGHGGVLLQSPSAPPPPGQWSRTSAAQPPPSRTETPGRPVAGMPWQGAPLPPTLPNPQNHDRNTPAKILGQRTHPSPTEGRNDKDYRPLGRRPSQQSPERSAVDAKRRRTTY